MDTTSDYVRMCSEATELQTKYAHGFSHGDYACGFHRGKDELIGWPYIVTSTRGLGTDRVRITIVNTVWLPRQDQLQTMVVPADYQMTSPMVLLLRRFLTFVANHELLKPSYTYEQYWLRYVMLVKHGKVWNGKTWEVPA